MSLTSSLLHGDDFLTRIMATACGGLVLSYVLFIFSIRREYIYSFFDPSTRSKHFQDNFTNRVEDEIKICIFRCHEAKSKTKIGNNVKVWLNDKIFVWLDEDPPWFTDNVKSTISDWVVADKNILAKLRNKRVETLRSMRRRASLLGLDLRLEGAGD